MANNRDTPARIRVHDYWYSTAACVAAPARAGARRGANPDLREVHIRRRAPTRRPLLGQAVEGSSWRSTNIEAERGDGVECCCVWRSTSLEADRREIARWRWRSNGAHARAPRLRGLAWALARQVAWRPANRAT